MTKREKRRRITALVGVTALLVSAMAATTTVALTATRAEAASAPASATDETKVPHYFGPYPNWANSPLTQSTAEVTFTDPSGSGTGAEAVAQVDPKTGGITAIRN